MESKSLKRSECMFGRFYDLYINCITVNLKIRNAYCFSANMDSGSASCFATIGNLDILMGMDIIGSCPSSPRCSLQNISICDAIKISDELSIIAIRVFTDKVSYLVQKSKRSVAVKNNLKLMGLIPEILNHTNGKRAWADCFRCGFNQRTSRNQCTDNTIDIKKLFINNWSVY